MKMYILTKGSLPAGHQANCAAHAALACYLKFQYDHGMVDWLEYSYRKVTCVVTDKQFKEAKRFNKYVVVREDTLEDVEVAIAFCPREEYDEWFSGLRLFGQAKIRFRWYRLKKWMQEKLDFGFEKDYTSIVHEEVPLDKEPGAIDRCVQVKR